MARTLHERVGMPVHLEVVAYLCVGYVDGFADEPELRHRRLGPAPPAVLGRPHETPGGSLPGEDPLDETLAALAASTPPRARPRRASGRRA